MEEQSEFLGKIFKYQVFESKCVTQGAENARVYGVKIIHINSAKKLASVADVSACRADAAAFARRLAAADAEPAILFECVDDFLEEQLGARVGDAL